MRGDDSMKVTIYEVAREAGVSTATVSKVINNTGNMREETRKRVLKVIKEMNYHPNLVASALTGKGTQTLGLLVPDISNPFFSAMARQIEDYADDQGMSVIMCSVDGNIEKERKYIELLRRKQVDGFIIASSFQDTILLKDIISQGFPIVMLSFDDATTEVSKVTIDDFKGGYEAASHLYAKGHREMAIIAEHANSSNLRIRGYRVALEGRELEFPDENVYRTTASIENGIASFDKIFQKENETFPTAIFACNDLLAIGVIQGATERGMNIPEELAIIGFDNTILATTTVPGLTTISQPIAEMAEKTVELIVTEIEQKKKVIKRVLFNPELICRGTT